MRLIADKAIREGATADAMAIEQIQQLGAAALTDWARTKAGRSLAPLARATRDISTFKEPRNRRTKAMRRASELFGKTVCNEIGWMRNRDRDCHNHHKENDSGDNRRQSLDGLAKLHGADCESLDRLIRNLQRNNAQE